MNKWVRGRRRETTRDQQRTDGGASDTARPYRRMGSYEPVRRNRRTGGVRARDGRRRDEGFSNRQLTAFDVEDIKFVDTAEMRPVKGLLPRSQAAGVEKIKADGKPRRRPVLGRKKKDGAASAESKEDYLDSAAVYEELAQQIQTLPENHWARMHMQNVVYAMSQSGLSLRAKSLFIANTLDVFRQANAEAKANQ